MNLSSTDLYKILRKNTNNIVTCFRTDWKADHKFIRSLHTNLSNKTITSIEFVHVAYNHGTWFFPIYRDNLDTERKYLFGSCTRRYTLSNFADIFHPDSYTVPSKCVIQHFDGHVLDIINKETARNLFIDAANRPRQQLAP